MGSWCSASESPPDTVEVKSLEQMPKEEEEAVGELLKEEDADQLKVGIKIVAARGLRNADWSWVPGQGVSDAYCQCMVDGKNVCSTPVIMNSLEPFWDYEFEGTVSRGKDMCFAVWDKDPMKPDDALGNVTLKSEVFMKGDGYNGELQLDEAGKGITAFVKIMVKVGDKDYPAGPGPVFDVTIEVPSEASEKPFGLVTDYAEANKLYVCDILEGPVMDYNAKVEETKQVKKGQYIIEANGVKGDAKKMLEAMTNISKLSLKIQRPQFFTIATNKRGSAGLGLSLTKATTSLIVTEVKKGELIDKWNSAHKDQQVIPNTDRVVAVGGMRGTSEELLAKLTGSGNMQILISRPYPEDTLAHKLWTWSFF